MLKEDISTLSTKYGVPEKDIFKWMRFSDEHGVIRPEGLGKAIFKIGSKWVDGPPETTVDNFIEQYQEEVAEAEENGEFFVGDADDQAEQKRGYDADYKAIDDLLKSLTGRIVNKVVNKELDSAGKIVKTSPLGALGKVIEEAVDADGNPIEPKAGYETAWSPEDDEPKGLTHEPEVEEEDSWEEELEIDEDELLATPKAIAAEREARDAKPVPVEEVEEEFNPNELKGLTLAEIKRRFRS